MDSSGFTSVALAPIVIYSRLHSMFARAPRAATPAARHQADRPWQARVSLRAAYRRGPDGYSPRRRLPTEPFRRAEARLPASARCPHALGQERWARRRGNIAFL